MIVHSPSLVREKPVFSSIYSTILRFKWISWIISIVNYRSVLKQPFLIWWDCGLRFLNWRNLSGISLTCSHFAMLFLMVRHEIKVIFEWLYNTTYCPDSLRSKLVQCFQMEFSQNKVKIWANTTSTKLC